tara:strand:- start:202 stop:558 length:357 start_codon:yes stop_codon:yes gene_type:complete
MPLAKTIITTLDVKVENVEVSRQVLHIVVLLVKLVMLSKVMVSVCNYQWEQDVKKTANVLDQIGVIMECVHLVIFQPEHSVEVSVQVPVVQVMPVDDLNQVLLAVVLLLRRMGITVCP